MLCICILNSSPGNAVWEAACYSLQNNCRDKRLHAHSVHTFKCVSTHTHTHCSIRIHRERTLQVLLIRKHPPVMTRLYQLKRPCSSLSLSSAILFYFLHFKCVQSSHPLPSVNATSSINNRRFICIYFHTILVNRGRSVSYVPRLSSCDKGTAKHWMSLCAVCTCGLFTGFGVSCC